jgi:hypothetical protein
MRKDDESWPDDVDIDRVRAAPRSIAGGWAVVAVIALLMLAGPSAICAVDVALLDAKQDVAKVERRLAHVLPIFDCKRSG